MNRLTFKEKHILSNQAYWAGRHPHSIILYIYFIVVRGCIIYVGKTGSPLLRETLHRTRLNASNIFNYKFVIFGPIEKSVADELEVIEISKRRSNKKLLNKNCKKINYDKNKKLSIKDYRQKAVSVIRKGCETKTVVGQFFN